MRDRGLRAYETGVTEERGGIVYLDVRQATFMHAWIKSCINIWKHSSGEGRRFRQNGRHSARRVGKLGVKGRRVRRVVGDLTPT